MRLQASNRSCIFRYTAKTWGPRQWQILSERIVQRTKEKSPHGIVVMMGTDTLAYASAALSFSLIGNEIPVVLVGAQISTDRPSSDGALNLKAASTFAVNSHLPGVYVAMHENENDDYIAIHSGVRVRKNHTSRRDAFESIDVPCVARVKENQITMIAGTEAQNRDGERFVQTENEIRRSSCTHQVLSRIRSFSVGLSRETRGK